MVIVHGTKRFRDRVHGVTDDVAADDDQSHTLLGPWYATLLRCRPVVALFVNESTLLPVLVAMAPARTTLHRFPAAVAEVLAAHRVPRELINAEVAEMTAVQLKPTINRSVVGVMNEFAALAAVTRDGPADDLLGLSVQLAATPCTPLYRRHISPDRELTALVAESR